MIGQFERFNEEKQKRDFRDCFFGIEATQLGLEEDIAKIKLLSECEGFKIGIHFPLRANIWRHRDPQYLSKDGKVREKSYNYMENEFKYASKVKPHYILIHYPKPVILDDRVNWTNWKFYDKTEYYYESTFSQKFFKEKSEKFFSWLSKKGKEFNFMPVLELDAVNKYIYDTKYLETLLEKYKNIKLCLDIGRIHMQDMIDKNFNGYEMVERFAKYAEVIHLWNVNLNIKGGHFPVLPTQKVSDGWADVTRYMNIISKQNSECKILFEHRSDLISDEELEQCYQWVKEMM